MLTGAPQLPQRLMGWGCWGVVMAGSRKDKARSVAGWWIYGTRTYCADLLMLGAAAESRASLCEHSAHTWHAWKRREPEAGFSLPHWMHSMVSARSWSRMVCWPFLGLRIDLLGTSAAALAPEMLHLRGWVEPRWRAVVMWLWLVSFRLAKDIPTGRRPTPCKKGNSSGKSVRGFLQLAGENQAVETVQ